MALSVSVKRVYTPKSISAPLGDSICSSFVSGNGDESSKSGLRACSSGQASTPRTVCVYNPQPFPLHIGFIFPSPVRRRAEVANLGGPTLLQVVIFCAPAVVSLLLYYIFGSLEARSRLWASRRHVTDPRWWSCNDQLIPFMMSKFAKVTVNQSCDGGVQERKAASKLK